MGLFAGTKWDIPPTCDHCGLEVDECTCPPKSEEIPQDLPERQNLVIRREKRKKGKVVTTISGFEYSHPQQLKNLLKELKDQFGTGGTLESDVVELQGDLGERVAKMMESKEYKVRRIG